jgi:hypothetical protein
LAEQIAQHGVLVSGDGTSVENLGDDAIASLTGQADTEVRQPSSHHRNARPSNLLRSTALALFALQQGSLPICMSIPSTMGF